jgi:hypothetical protein
MTTSSGAAGGPGGDGAAAGAGRRGGPPIWFAVLGIGGLVLAVVVIAAQALGIGGGAATAPATIPPTGDAAARTHDLVAKALADASFQVTDPQTPYRPGESPALIDAPRRLLQVVLPSDPTGGYIVIYELPSNTEADRLGRDFATYLAGGTGAIQYPRDAQFVLRRVGRTLVFFPWSPSVSPDPRVAELAGILTTVGEPVTP